MVPFKNRDYHPSLSSKGTALHLDATLKRHANNTTPTLSNTFNISGQICCSFDIVTVCNHHCNLSQSKGLQKNRVIWHCLLKGWNVTGLNNSPTCSIHCSTISPVEVNTYMHLLSRAGEWSVLLWSIVASCPQPQSVQGRSLLDMIICPSLKDPSNREGSL